MTISKKKKATLTIITFLSILGCILSVVLIPKCISKNNIKSSLKSYSLLTNDRSYQELKGEPNEPKKPEQLKESNLDQILKESTEEFEKRDAKDKQTHYVLEFIYNSSKKEWKSELKNGGEQRLDSEKTVFIPNIPCNFCTKGNYVFTSNNRIQSKAKESNLKVLISNNGSFLIIPVKCIKFWFDFESKHLDGNSIKEKKKSLILLQKSILALALIVHEEVCNIFGWDSEIFHFNINVGNNEVPHIHFRFTKKIDQKDRNLLK